MERVVQLRIESKDVIIATIGTSATSILSFLSSILFVLYKILLTTP